MISVSTLTGLYGCGGYAFASVKRCSRWCHCRQAVEISNWMLRLVKDIDILQCLNPQMTAVLLFKVGM